MWRVGRPAGDECCSRPTRRQGIDCACSAPVTASPGATGWLADRCAGRSTEAERTLAPRRATLHVTARSTRSQPARRRRSCGIANTSARGGARRVDKTLARPRRSRAALAGFLVGDTRSVPDSVVAEFRAAGLTHLTAVSGENVAFVLAFVAAAAAPTGPPRSIRRLDRRPPAVRHHDALGAVGGACDRDGGDRAARRPPRPAARRAPSAPPRGDRAPPRGPVPPPLGRVPLVVRGEPRDHAVVCAPIAGPTPPRSGLGARHRWAVSTAAAQLGVLPVLVPVFGSMPLVALPANLVAVPLAEPLTIVG